jgi:hypothetical protein
LANFDDLAGVLGDRPDRQASHAAGVFIPASDVSPDAIAAAVTSTSRAIAVFSTPANDATSDAMSRTTGGAASIVAAEDIPASYTCSTTAATQLVMVYSDRAARAIARGDEPTRRGTECV